MLIQITEPTKAKNTQFDDTVAVGIDLGTTHTLVAISKDQQVQVLADDQGHVLIPSIVDMGDVHPLRSFKRFMGKPLVLTGQEEKAHQIAIEASAEVLKIARKRAENYLKKSVDKAVITVPAYFDEAARTATRDAARLAGLEVLRLLNEPTAAAVAYGLDEKNTGTFVIYDLGGGTFDCSILKLEKGVFQVLATVGDVELGGDDFDRALFQLICGQCALKESFACVQPKARQLKEALSTQDNVDFEGTTISRTTFESCINPLVERTLTCVTQALRDAGLAAQDIDGVVLVGGATRMPLVQSKVRDYFGREPLCSLNPDTAVVMGAALQAENLIHHNGTLLLDVTPLSLGLETYGGGVARLIERNSPIPISKVQEFTTFQDGQNGMSFHIVQGEREMAQDCKSLTRFELTGIPPMTAGAARIRVEFHLDGDGLLTVSAHEAQTGITQRIEVKPTYGLSEDDLRAMILESFDHAQEDLDHRRLVEARIGARRLLNSTVKALMLDGDLIVQAERDLILKAVHDLESILDTHDAQAIDIQGKYLDQLCQDFAEKRMNKAIKAALTGARVDDVQQKLQVG